MLRAAVKRLPPIRRLVEQRDVLLAEVERLQPKPVPPAPGAPEALRFPAGHYYSPIPSIEEVKAREEQIFATPASLPAIDMRAAAQLELVERLSRFYADQPFDEEPVEGLRYHFENGWFQFADGLILYGLMRHLRPGRVIEIGSGFSSALMLDTDDLFLGSTVKFTFIDPNPERLLGLLRDQDTERVELVFKPVQEIALSLFEQLEAGDMLFVDSSHVSRVGSDVNRIFFEILPQLRPGVVVHFHDIFHPFEYPKDWIYMGRFFTEAYLARAFLMYNPGFEVLLSNSFLYKFHADRVGSLMPLWAKKEGASLWLRRV